MMRGMDRAQAQYDAMQPPDYYEPDTEPAEDDEPDYENEKEAQAEWEREFGDDWEDNE